MCFLDGDAVLLDLRSARYFSISSRFLPSILHRLHGAPQTAITRASVSDEEAHSFLETLIKDEVLTTTKARDITAAISPQIIIGSSFHPDIAQYTYSFEDLWTLIISVCVAKFSMSSARLHWVIRNTRKLKSSLTGKLSLAPDSYTLSGKFLRMRTWFYTAHNYCLLDSLTLAQFLLRRRISATLVLGIETSPFGAHAWVQIGDVVINDSVEVVRRYTPILVV